ncbi:hypothetical protein PPYR_03884 [Photinus pyralis]|uniref:Paired domain-containing protein n=1 Tax=Photinus pyralis TaxID=7054 RepID=A0A5N4AWT0_PHOPY|nr:hypothetical protein PPYR_03884 [Photinus pyralis]
MLNDDPGTKMVTIVAKIDEGAGIAKSTVYRTIKEYKKTGAVTPSKRSGGRPPLVSQFDDSIKSSVRQIIHNFFYLNELPTLDKINSREDLSQMPYKTVWTDDNVRTRRQAFEVGLSTGLKNPSGKGKRLIILHVGSENSFVNEGLLLFEGRKTSIITKK